LILSVSVTGRSKGTGKRRKDLNWEKRERCGVLSSLISRCAKGGERRKEKESQSARKGTQLSYDPSKSVPRREKGEKKSSVKHDNCRRGSRRHESMSSSVTYIVDFTPSLLEGREKRGEGKKKEGSDMKFYQGGGLGRALILFIFYRLVEKKRRKEEGKGRGKKKGGIVA